MSAIRSLKSRPRWLFAFVILSSVSIMIFLIRRPHVIEETVRLLPPSVHSFERDAIHHRLESETVLRASFVPIRMFIAWSCIAGVVWFVLRLGSPPRRPRYVEVLSAEVHAEAFHVGGELASIAYAVYTGWSLPQQYIPLSAASGYHDGGIFYVALNALNPFSLSYLIALSFFIVTLAEISKIRAFLTIVLSYGAFVVLNITMVKLVVDALHLKF